jgi:hypothetical protein
MFAATWAISLSVWRFGRIEERWSSHLEGVAPAGERIEKAAGIERARADLANGA